MPICPLLFEDYHFNHISGPRSVWQTEFCPQDPQKIKWVGQEGLVN